MAYDYVLYCMKVAHFMGLVSVGKHAQLYLRLLFWITRVTLTLTAWAESLIAGLSLQT